MSKLLVTIGLMAMLAFSLVLFITIAAAYASPTKAVNVRINSMGEAHVEMVLVTILLPVGILSAIFAIKRFEQIEKESYILQSLKRTTNEAENL